MVRGRRYGPGLGLVLPTGVTPEHCAYPDPLKENLQNFGVLRDGTVLVCCCFVLGATLGSCQAQEGTLGEALRDPNPRTAPSLPLARSRSVRPSVPPSSARSSQAVTGRQAARAARGSRLGRGGEAQGRGARRPAASARLHGDQPGLASGLPSVDRAMDADGLLLSLELASGSGQGLSPDRRASLLTSLRLVARDYRFARVLFWGRVLGVAADYFVAQGLAADQLAPRKTLYRCPGRAGTAGTDGWTGGRTEGPGRLRAVGPGRGREAGAGLRRFRGRDWASGSAGWAGLGRSEAGSWRARGRDWPSALVRAGPCRWGRGFATGGVAPALAGTWLVLRERRLGQVGRLWAGPRRPRGCDWVSAPAGRGRTGRGRDLDVPVDVVGPPRFLGGARAVGGGARRSRGRDWASGSWLGGTGRSQP